MERLSREFEKAEIDEDKVIRKLQRMEQSVFKDIEKDIFALFGRYATENNLTYEEAIRLLTSDEYRDFKMDVGSYIKTINNESVDEKAREKLELEYNTLAMKTRISRLEELTYRANKNLDTLFFVTHRAVKELLEKSVTKSYNSAHTLKRDSSLRDKKLYKILEQPWSGANYSANIWNNRDKLAGIAQNEITKGIYQGKSAKKISKNISERLDASMKDIERVVRTESKHARNEAAAQAYIDMGYEWYMFSSHTEGKSSERTCERCREINEEKYRFDKRVVGENFPPLHPNCRCTIIPVINEDKKLKRTKEERKIYEETKDRTTVDFKKINSKKYRDKLDSLGEDKRVTKMIYESIKEILKSKDKTEFEGSSFVFTDTKKSIVTTVSVKPREAKPTKRMMKELQESKPYSVIGIHNHPGSNLPSYGDLKAANDRKYKYALIACHNGDIIKYKVSDKIEYIDKDLYELRIKGSNGSLEELNKKLQEWDIRIWKI